jgi:hypothetical protein
MNPLAGVAFNPTRFAIDHGNNNVVHNSTAFCTTGFNGITG